MQIDEIKVNFNDKLKQLLNQVKEGTVDVEEAMKRLASLPYQDLGFARPDHHRALRQGFSEVIMGQGKTPEQIISIARELLKNSPKVLVTRVSPENAGLICRELPEGKYNRTSGTISFNLQGEEPSKPGIMIVCGGTADLPVAEEAVETASLMGNVVERAYDVGVAGLHRLLDILPRLRAAKVIIVAAGMDGVLPSIVGGLVCAPVIAVPTSTGYGANFSGLAPLLTMLNSCAPGVAVVNIDNGFGAGYLAALINGQSK